MPSTCDESLKWSLMPAIYNNATANNNRLLNCSYEHYFQTIDRLRPIRPLSSHLCKHTTIPTMSGADIQYTQAANSQNSTLPTLVPPQERRAGEREREGLGHPDDPRKNCRKQQETDTGGPSGEPLSTVLTRKDVLRRLKIHSGAGVRGHTWVSVVGAAQQAALL